MAVIDASVAVRWFVSGPGHERAAEWLVQTDLIAPDLLTAEVGNALWLYTRHGALEIEEAQAIAERLPQCFRSLVPNETLLVEALELAGRYANPLYDCLYLALAQRERRTIVTLDRAMARIARAAKIPADVLL